MKNVFKIQNLYSKVFINVIYIFILLVYIYIVIDSPTELFEGRIFNIMFFDYREYYLFSIIFHIVLVPIFIRIISETIIVYFEIYKKLKNISRLKEIKLNRQSVWR